MNLSITVITLMYIYHISYKYMMLITKFLFLPLWIDRYKTMYSIRGIFRFINKKVAKAIEICVLLNPYTHTYIQLTLTLLEFIDPYIIVLSRFHVTCIFANLGVRIVSAQIYRAIWSDLNPPEINGLLSSLSLFPICYICRGNKKKKEKRKKP